MSDEQVKPHKTHHRPSQKNLGQASLVALLWSGLEQWGGQLFSLLFYILLARLLGPDEFGLVAMAGVYIAFVQLFVNQGLAMALVQREDLQDNHVDSAFWASVTFGVGLTAVSWLVAGSVASIYKQPELEMVIKALSLTLVFTSLDSVQSALLKRNLQFKPLAVRTVVATVAGGVVGVAMALAGFGIWSLVVQQLISGFVRLVLLWAQSKWRPGFRFSYSALREIMPFSLNIMGANLVEFGNRFSDKFIIGFFLGPAALGFYVLAYKLYRTLTILLTGFIGQVAVSSFSAIQHDKPKVRDTFYRVTRLAAFVSFPVFALVAAVAGIAFPVLLGERWEQSVAVFQVLAVAGALECVFLFNANVMIALGKAHWRFRLGALSAVLNIAGFFIAVRYGIAYVALAYVLRMLLVSPLPIYLVKLLVNVKAVEYLKGLMVPALGVLGIVGASFYLPDLAKLIKAPVILLVLFSLACGVFYLLLTIALNHAVVADVKLLGKFFKDKRASGSKMWRLVLLGMIMLPAGLAGVFFVTQSDKWKYGDSFLAVPTQLDAYDLYDIGVAKIDSDERLDIFTVNHSSRQQVLFGNAEYALMSDLELGQVTGFPGAEAKSDGPDVKQPGLHIFRKGKNLHMVAHQLDSLGLQLPSRITIELPWPIKVVSSKSATATLSQKQPTALQKPSGSALPPPDNMISVADITLQDNSQIVITGDQDILELGHTISILDEALRANTYIGGSQKQEVALPIELLWRDRHAMIWRDIDGDDDSDVFIARGGVKGQLASVPARVYDELLVRQGKSAEDIAALTGMQKNSCPGRQSAWTDADNDGALDIHISCGRVAFEDPHPDQLYVERQGQYSDIAKKLGIDYAGVSVFKWADFDVDGDLDLFSAQSNSLVLYTNNDGVFNETVFNDISETKPTQVVVADIDHDGDLDAFVVQTSGSVVLVNTDNTYSVQPAESIGLPSQLKAMSVVDYDNDGLADVHLVPGGLFKAVAPGQYEKMNLLTGIKGVSLTSEARCAWLDQDMNGLLDVTCAVRIFPHKIIRVWKKGVQNLKDARYWVNYAAKNQISNDNNWLQLDLNAGAANAEGIGAVVSLTSNGRTQIATVGQSDSAHYSQGHYRLYFGLGQSTAVDKITVHWPGGEQQEFAVPEVNTLLELSRTSRDNQ